MKLEKRSLGMGRTIMVIGICENEEESRIIDTLGDNLEDRESIPIKGEIKLSDDCQLHYIILKPNKEEEKKNDKQKIRTLDEY